MPLWRPNGYWLGGRHKKATSKTGGGFVLLALVSVLLVVIGAELQPYIRCGFAAKLARYGKLHPGLSLGLSQGAIA